MREVFFGMRLGLQLSVLISLAGAVAKFDLPSKLSQAVAVDPSQKRLAIGGKGWVDVWTGLSSKSPVRYKIESQNSDPVVFESSRILWILDIERAIRLDLVTHAQSIRPLQPPFGGRILCNPG
jgi:hypothetical protein